MNGPTPKQLDRLPSAVRTYIADLESDNRNLRASLEGNLIDTARISDARQEPTVLYDRGTGAVDPERLPLARHSTIMFRQHEGKHINVRALYADGPEDGRLIGIRVTGMRRLAVYPDASNAVDIEFRD